MSCDWSSFDMDQLKYFLPGTTHHWHQWLNIPPIDVRTMTASHSRPQHIRREQICCHLFCTELVTDLVSLGPH